MAIWAFDIETYAWDRFLLGAAVSDDGRVERFRTSAEVAAWYISTGRGDIVLAHNGGHFDFLYLLDVVPGTWRATMSGSGVISMRQTGHAECRDTFRFAPLSLDKWTGQKDARVIDCAPSCDAPGCRGYCRFDPKLHTRAEYTRIMDYCIQDCRALLSTWLEYVERLESLGVAVRGRSGVRRTIGGIAWATVAEICDVGPVPDFEQYESDLLAYYGGDVQVYRVRADSGHRYDVNSMYTWGLLQDMPIGPRRILSGPAALHAFVAQKPGIYRARGVTPDGRVPLLPRRAKDGSVIWATGHFEGSYTEPELRFAVEHGAKIKTVETAWVYPRTAAVFKPWVDLAYGIRERAAKDGDERMRAYAKWLCNSATGKLAQGCEQVSLYVRPDDDTVRRWQHMSEAERERIGLAYLGGDAWSQVTRRDVPSCARPIWAAYLIAYARTRLHERLLRAGAGAIYCDTDSAYTIDRDETDVDPVRLGAWKYEGAMSEWRAVAPKLYRYRPDDGAAVAKAKGIPRATPDILRRLEAGEDIPLDTGVEGVRRSFRESGRAFARKRTSRGLRHDRRVAGLRWITRDGTTIAARRLADGSYIWPGVSVRPRDVTRRLRDGA